MAVGAVDVLGEGACEGELGGAFGALEQDGVGEFAVVDERAEVVLDLGVARDVAETHG